MKSFDDVSAWLSGQLEAAAGALLALRAGFRRARTTRLVEEEKNVFRLEAAPPPGPQAEGERPASLRFEPAAEPPAASPPAEAGARSALAAALFRADVELVLRADRFLFRPLDLPGRAAEFLDGVVRSQIDRLTPWSAADAAFGHRPAETTDERLRVLVAATSRAALAPFVETARSHGADRISVFAAAPEPGGAPIAVLAQPIADALDAGRLKRVLGVALLGLWMACALALLVSSFAVDALDGRREAASAESQRLRAALTRDEDAASAPAAALRERKAAAAPAVLLYDELARVLPDDAYLTELRFSPDKIQIAGLAHDPPALIRLIERSPKFAHAVFYAPTTASPSEAAQHFFIEAQIAPDAGRAAER